MTAEPAADPRDGALHGRVAIVTGAGQGIGRGIALALAAEGAAVALAGRTLDKLEAVAREIGDRGGDALPLRCDVTQPDDVRNAVARTVAELSGVHILVNNAHETPRQDVPLADTTDDDLEAQLSSGPVAVHRFMRECLPHLAARGGVVVNCAGGVAVDPQRGLGAYAAAKAAVVALTRVAALEWGELGIRVVAVAAGGMSSPAMSEWARREPEHLERVLASRPIRRLGDPELDAGRVVAFLAGPDAAFVTGTLIPVNGGYTYLH